MQPLFAQFGDDAEWMAFLGILVAILVGVLLIYIFFLITLQKALGRCRPQNRTMEPGMVWLNLIPLFNIVWQFITVIRVSSSLTNEFRSRGRHRKDEDYAQTLGITAFGLNCAGVIPLLGILCGIGGFVCWIIYWVKVSGFSNQLAASPAQDYDDEDDYDAPRARADQPNDGDKPRRPNRPWDGGGK